MQPFDGIDVLDFTQSVAGPVCTSMLGILGANVVKVEPPGGDSFRGFLDGDAFTTVNLGKQSVAIDLKTDEGQAIARDLAQKADVIVESFRPGVMDRFGLGFDEVVTANPEVVYCSITGFGQEGPYSEYPAYDPVLQAMSGLMSVIGYPDRPPARIGASVIDYSTGANAAFLVASALNGDRGNHIDIALFDVAVSWMGYWLARYTRIGEPPTRAGAGFHGNSPNGIFHAAGAEPFYLVALNDEQFDRLCRAIDRQELGDDPRFQTNADRWEHRDDLQEELDSEFGEYPRDELVERLAAAGVPVGPQQEIDDLLTDPQVGFRDLLVEAENPHANQRVTTTRLPITTAEWVPDLPERPPACGEHTRQVLSSFGYDAAEIDELVAEGVVNEHS